MVAEEIREAVRAGGLLDGAGVLVAMISGGRDSVCLLDVAVALRGAQKIAALHVNYGLRAEAGADERCCVELCERLGVELSVVRADANAAEGNVQAWARELRYAAARELARRVGGAREPGTADESGIAPEPSAARQARGAAIATGHTASDQVETILYRLAASPGRRALLGMAPVEGEVVRPLLGVTREQTAAYCRERGLRWREDASNEDTRYARARVRATLVPALRSLHPAAESNVLRTASLLREETELLDALVDAELDGGASIPIERLRALPAALARLLVVRLAEDAAGTYVPQAGERVGELLALGRRGARAELHLGAGAGAVVEDGVLSFRRLAAHETSMRAPKTPPGAD